MKIQIGKYFFLEEFVVTEQNIKLILPYKYIANIKHIVDTVLDPIREEFGQTIITSAYRSQQLNALVGGVDNSSHLTCEGVDFICPDADMHDVLSYILNEVRHEWATFYEDKGHIHVTKYNA